MGVDLIHQKQMPHNPRQQPVWSKPIFGDEPDEEYPPHYWQSSVFIPRRFSRRMAELSRPKPDHMPEWNRPHGMQVAWRNQQPLKPVKIFDKAPNKRLLELAKPRKRHDQPILYQYTCGQPDGISKPCMETKQRCMSARL